MATTTGLFNFDGIDGATPWGGLIADANGDLFGSTQTGGAYGHGTVFELVNNGGSYTLVTLVNFNDTDGCSPNGLTIDANGNLFGTTWDGGTSDDGTVFEIAKTAAGYANTPTTLYNFSGTDGLNPTAGLTADASGDLFGMTWAGGANGDGTVFEVAKTTTGYVTTTLYSFSGPDGINPTGRLIADANGDLFGMTQAGGDYGDGTVFEMVKTATGYVTTTLRSFSGGDGRFPTGGLIADANGDLFGTTQAGGTYGYGTVFEFVNNGDGSYSYQNLVSFKGTDGASPLSNLIIDANGDLFGTTSETINPPNAAFSGTVFEIAHTDAGYARTPTTVVSFNTDVASSVINAYNINVASCDATYDPTTCGADTTCQAIITQDRFDCVNQATLTEAAGLAAAPSFGAISSLYADASGNLFCTAAGANGLYGTVFEITNSGFITASPSKYWTGTGWVLADGTATAAPGATDTAIIGGTANGVTFTQAGGTVPLSGEVGTVIIAAGGRWLVTGTGSIDDLKVDTSAIVSVGAGTTVRHLDVVDTFGPNPPVPAIPAGIVIGSELAVGASIDFGEAVKYTSSFNGTNTNLVVTAIASNLIIANITLLGNIGVGANGANTELDVTSALPPDPGPTASNVTAAANLGTTIDLTSAVLAQVTAGQVGEIDTITGFGSTSQGGLVGLTNGDLTYGAQSNGALAHIPANGSLVDTFTYTVTDQYDQRATGSVNVTVSNPAIVINGPIGGNATIRGGSATNIVNAHGTGNTIIESGGNDVVNAGAGSATVTTGSGDVVVNLNGKNNTVNGGNGNDTVNILSGGNNDIRLGTGTDRVVEAAGTKGDSFILTGSNASLVLGGANDVVFIKGGTDTIADQGQGLELKIGATGGVVGLTGFGADKTGFVDLVGGIGGFKTAKAVVAALKSDGHGGTLLSFGSAGQIDFLGVALGTLKVSSFQIG